MHAVVAKFARAPIPKPVPVVMQQIVTIRLLGRGSLPYRIIKPLRHGRSFALADGGAMIGVPAARKCHATNLSPLERVHGFIDPWPAPALIAHLHHAFVLPRRSDDHFAFVKIMAAGLLDIHVFSRGAAKNGRWRV